MGKGCSLKTCTRLHELPLLWGYLRAENPGGKSRPISPVWGSLFSMYALSVRRWNGSVFTLVYLFWLLILLCFSWVHSPWVGLQCDYLELELGASCRRNQPASEMPSYLIGSLRVRNPPMPIKMYRAASRSLTILYCISHALSCW